MNNVKTLINNTLVKEDWKNPGVKFDFSSGCSCFEALKAVTSQLADFQEEARQDGSYVKTVKFDLKTADKDFTKEFHFDSFKELDKVISDYFIEVVPGDGVVSQGSLEVIFA